MNSTTNASIVEKNGLIYMYNFPKDYDWCTNTYNNKLCCNMSYFPLNTTTRQYFKTDILPIIKSGLCFINDDLYQKIRLFKQNPERVPPNMIAPSGISLKQHQLDALNKMLSHRRYGFFLGTGSGKTLIAITYLLSAKPNTCLIVTPQKVIGQYKSELDKYIPNNTYEVTNYEQLGKYINKKYDTLILDESHRAKNFTSNININCRLIAKKANDVYLFTGTPQDKSRHEILSQIAILDERVMPVKTKIYDRYFNINDYFQPSSEKKDRKQELTDLINEYTWGKKTEDVVENLPTERSYLIKCDHPNMYYDKLFKDRVVIKDDLTCEGDNKGVLRISLREICSGCITWTKQDTSTVTECFNTGKKEKLYKLVSEIPAGIIYYEFTASLNEIQSVLQEAGRSFVVVNGTCSAKKSAELIQKFKQGDAEYLVIQSRSGNAGLDLTNVNNIIFYALPESYIVYTQAKARIRRIGQTKECNYYHLICENTVEELIYNTLEKKKSFSDKIFLQYIEGDKKNGKTKTN